MSSIPDVMEVAKSGYNLLLENSRVRVLEIRLKPGEKSPMHNHPNDHVIYVVKMRNLNCIFQMVTPKFLNWWKDRLNG